MLSIIPSELFRWILVGVGFVVSAIFMVKSAHTITSRSEDKRASSFVLPLMLFAQFSLALVFKMVFFKFVVLKQGPGSGGGDTGGEEPKEPAPGPAPTGSPDGGNGTMMAFF